MNISRFFVDRPIFAAVLSLLITVAGALSLFVLPISEYPSVVPPTVVVRGTYPGANPKTIAETVAAPLEQQLNGVEGMLYMFSQSTSDGLLTLTVTFALGTDLDKAQVQVQNRVAQALPRLPQEVQRIGVVTEKASPDLMMVVHIVSPDQRYDMLYLSNLAYLQVKDELSRIDGVGSVQVFGAGEFSMRVWLDPDRLAASQLTATDVVRAIREQNVQVAAGVLGAPPAPTDTTFQLLINAQGRLSTEEEFAAIVVRATPQGQITRLRDVGRVELGSNRYALRSLLDNKPAVAIGISQRPGSNALQASADVRARMAALKEAFPQGVDYRIEYDPTVYVRKSIHAVVETLFEAILLVVIVVLVFLQTWRASIIPLVAVPVSLIGTFAVMLALGFSLNTLSLFGLVLAIGIVVDDAIVVVENVERHIELGLSPTDATHKAMEEVSGPIIAIALVLCAVFVPTAFVSGLTGQFYRQFALTIAISTVISAFNSLTLSPALASRLLRPHGAPRDAVQRVADRLFGWFFVRFNRFFARASNGYTNGVSRLLRVGAAAIVLYVGLLGLTALGFSRVPAGFVPTQDKDYLVAFAQLPDASTLDRTDAVIQRMSAIALEASGREERDLVPRPLHQRVRQRVQRRHRVRDAQGCRRASPRRADRQPDRAGPEPAVRQHPGRVRRDLPAATRAGHRPGRRLQAVRRGSRRCRLRGPVHAGAGRHRRGLRQPSLVGLLSSFQVSVPQIDAHVDRERAKTYGVPITDVFETLQAYLGSVYVNDFNRFGRTYQVNVQAEQGFRLQPEQIARLKTRNAAGVMVPLGSLVTVSQGYGPDQVMHYNGFPAAEINGGPAPRFSSGQAQDAIAQVLERRLPRGFTYEWTELAYQQAIAGNTMLWIFPLCVLLVYVVLAAQYESWSLPIGVILIVPMSLCSAIAGVWLTGGDNNVFTQVSFLVLAALACKNAILIIEFAKQRQEEGETPLQAILDACRVRLRPVLMTSVAFIMGVIPLVLSTGAGAEIRQAMGIAVFAGMLGVTFFGLILTPVFFLFVGRLVGWFTRRRGAALEPAELASPAEGL